MGVMTDSSHRQVDYNAEGDLVWTGHDLGSAPMAFFGGSDYEFWRTVREANLPALLAALGGAPGDDLPALVAERFKSDVQLEEFATKQGIPTEFFSWTSTDWNDDD